MAFVGWPAIASDTAKWANHADWVRVDDMDQYKILYFPYPIMFTSAQAKLIADCVQQGGTLISEVQEGAITLSSQFDGLMPASRHGPMMGRCWMAIVLPRRRGTS